MTGCRTESVQDGLRVSDRSPNADEWRKIYEALRNEAQEGDNQLAVRYIKAHVTVENRKHRNKVAFNTAGQGRTDASPTWQTWTRRAKWLASELQAERDTNVSYATHFHKESRVRGYAVMC